MNDESVDIVDIHNKILYQTYKREAHKKGLLHQTVISEIINSEGDWTLVKQSSFKQDSGRFVSPIGGHVRSGESIEDALKREAHVECRLRDFTFKFKGKCIYNRNVLGRQENHYFMIYEIHSNAKIILNNESDGFRTFTTDELKKLIKVTPELFGDAFFPVIECCYEELLGKN